MKSVDALCRSVRDKWEGAGASLANVPESFYSNDTNKPANPQNEPKT